jgi:hypothetical protein
MKNDNWHGGLSLLGNDKEGSKPGLDFFVALISRVWILYTECLDAKIISFCYAPTTPEPLAIGSTEPVKPLPTSWISNLN